MSFLNRRSPKSQASNPRFLDGPSGNKKFNPSRPILVLPLTIGLIGLIIIGLVLIGLLVRVDYHNEAKYINHAEIQAVFLSNGQSYFGTITALNNRYLRLSDVYYLHNNQSAQSNQNASASDDALVKLGCELHGPEDAMVFNRSQVAFWENLKPGGQVSKAVVVYKKQNPNGQICAPTPAPTPTAANPS